jgi:uncharacterized protein with PIN domain
MQTAEEFFEEYVYEWHTHANEGGKAAIVTLEQIKARDAAVRTDERERCAKAVCDHCRAELPLLDRGSVRQKMVQTDKLTWFHDLSGVAPGWMEQVLCKAG